MERHGHAYRKRRSPAHKKRPKMIYLSVPDESVTQQMLSYICCLTPLLTQFLLTCFPLKIYYTALQCVIHGSNQTEYIPDPFPFMSHPAWKYHQPFQQSLSPSLAFSTPRQPLTLSPLPVPNPLYPPFIFSATLLIVLPPQLGPHC